MFFVDACWLIALETVNEAIADGTLAKSKYAYSDRESHYCYRPWYSLGSAFGDLEEAPEVRAVVSESESGQIESELSISGGRWRLCESVIGALLYVKLAPRSEAELLRIAHTLTGYHRRRLRGRRLAICSCGWKNRAARRNCRARLRGLLCLVAGHRLDELSHAYVGPAGYGEDGPDTLFLSNRQCERCHEVITVRQLLVDEFGPGFGPKPQEPEDPAA